LHNLAQVELKQGHLSKAAEYNQRVVADGPLDPKEPLRLYHKLTVAELAMERQSLDEAAKLLHEILATPQTDDSLRWQAESDLANVNVAQGNYVAAEREFQRGIQIVEKASGEVAQEERRMSILDAWPFYDDYIHFLIDRGNYEQALQIAEFSRARTLAEAFKVKERGGKTGLQVPRVQTRQIQSSLRANQIILPYWLAEKESYLWDITPPKFQLFRLPAKDKIERAIQFNSGYIDQRRTPEDSPAAQELYEMLVKPAEALIPKNAHVIIAPNRSLYKLN